MKKLLFLLMICLSIGIAVYAQDKTKVEKTSSATQRVHNAVSKHKRYSGYKVKRHGHKHKVSHKKHEVKNKAI